MDKTSEFSKKDIEENKSIAAFGYFGISFVMPLFAASDSDFARFHANQGAVLAINELIIIAFIIIADIAASLFGSMIFKYLMLILIVALFLGMFFYIPYGIISAASGKARELPFIGKMRIFK